MNNFSLEKFNDDMFEVESFLGMDHTLESLMPVIEGYVGRNKHTQKIEDACRSLCKKYKGASIPTISTAEINNSKEITEIQRAIEDLTGFKTVDIVVFNRSIVNAYTLPKSCIQRIATNKMPTVPTAHGKLYYDDSHSYYCLIVLYAELFAKLEADEVTAFILHEVGHNFDHTLTWFLFDAYVWVLTMPGAPLSPLINWFRTEVRASYEHIVKILDYIPLVPIVRNYFDETLKGLGMLLGPLGGATTLLNVLEQIIKNPTGMVISGSRVHQELFADSYVTALGYGDAMIHALNKVDTEYYSTKNGALVEAWTGSGQAAAAILLMFVDPHPENQSRARRILDDMEDLSKNKDLPPKFRKAVAEDHKRCKKAYNDFLEVDPDERNAVCTRFSRRLKESCFNGKVDFRLLLVNLLGGTRATYNH